MRHPIDQISAGLLLEKRSRRDSNSAISGAGMMMRGQSPPGSTRLCRARESTQFVIHPRSARTRQAQASRCGAGAQARPRSSPRARRRCAACLMWLAGAVATASRRVVNPHRHMPRAVDDEAHRRAATIHRFDLNMSDLGLGPRIEAHREESHEPDLPAPAPSAAPYSDTTFSFALRTSPPPRMKSRMRG